jgi:hypothetical protein
MTLVIRAGLVALVLAPVVGAASSFDWPLTYDASLMHYAAWLIANGAVPYRDFLDMNQPGTYLIHLAAIRLFGPGDLAWRIFDLLWLASGCAAAAAIARRHGALAACLAAGLIGAYHLSFTSEYLGQRDFFVAVLLLGAVLTLVRYHESGRAGGLLLAGALIGAAVTIKLTVLLFFLQMATQLIWFRAGDARAVAREIVALGLGTALPLAAVAAYLLVAGALPAFLGDYVPYLRVYAGVNDTTALEMTENLLRWCGEIAPALGFALLFLAVPELRRRLSFVQHAALQGMLFGLAAFVLQAKGWQYHLYPFFFFAMLLGATCAAELIGRGGHRLRQLAIVLFLFAGFGYVPWLTWHAVAHEPSQAMQTRMREDLREIVRTRGIDRVQVLDTAWGGIEALYRLNIVQPTPFIYDWQFFVPLQAPILDRLKQRFLADLAAHKPGAIVITAQAWPLEKHGYDRIGTWAEFARLLAGNYSLAIERDGYRIYVTHTTDHPKL